MALILGSAPVEATVGETDSLATLPFLTLEEADGRFAISHITVAYERDLNVFLAPADLEPWELAELDRHGYFPDWDVPIRSHDDHAMEQRTEPRVAELNDTEKKELRPPAAGVQVGIPSVVSTTGTLLGGLGLLIKVLSDLF